MDDRKLEQLSFGEDDFLIVGIAASAEGQKALQAFLQSMPNKDNSASIIVDPTDTEIKLTPSNNYGDVTVRVTRSDNSKLARDENKSDRKLAQNQLHLETVLNHTTSLVSIKDIKGNYILANAQFLKLLNQEEKAVIGKSDFDLFPYEMAKTLQHNDRQTLASKTSLQFEETLQLARGTRTYLAIKTPLYNSDRKIYGICTIATDITAQKQTEEALRKSATRERTTLKIVQKISKTLDRQEIFTLTSQELRKVLKCDRVAIYSFNQDWSGQFVAESVGDRWNNLVEVNKHKVWADTYLQENKGGVCALDEVFVVNDIFQGDLTDCHINLLKQFQAKACCVVPIIQRDTLWGLLSVYQNSTTRQWQAEEIRLLTQVAIQLGITIEQADLFTQIRNQSDRLQQAKEAAETANKAKTAFIAHMNHELRTPLNAILGSAEILSETVDITEQQNKINLIHQSGKHLHTLINDVLSLAQLEAGKLKLRSVKFDFALFLDNILDIMSIRAAQKNIKLNYQIISSLPSTIFCDETRLRQVLLNLLSNAIKFTQNGSVTFKVGYKKDFDTNSAQNKKQSIRFYIEDTGIGIASSQFTDIFVPFQQLGEGDLYTEGTGLGLTISQNIVRLMGSEIQVESSLGKGSTFWFDLDLNPLINFKNIEDIEENIYPQTVVTTQNEVQNIIVPPLRELYGLQELLILGNIRGLLNKVADLEKSNPELSSFTHQVRYLAESCHIDLLENFLQSFV